MRIRPRGKERTEARVFFSISRVSAALTGRARIPTRDSTRALSSSDQTKREERERERPRVVYYNSVTRLRKRIVDVVSGNGTTSALDQNRADSRAINGGTTGKQSELKFTRRDRRVSTRDANCTSLGHRPRRRFAFADDARR